MTFDLKTIEALAPDQASLNSASKLTRKSNWVRLEKHDSLLWGECQGSGANPYRVVVDAGDQGYKCTCPSRKFPCKHSLALMWISATQPNDFSPSNQIPEWVNDWLGRRRKGAASTAPAAGPAGKSIGEAEATVIEAKAEDPAAAERREAAQKKRADDTRVSIAAGLEELDQWISDQLRLGLSSFVDAAGERCRRIAARLVDAKAAALASRLDEFPATLLALRSEERPEAAIRELGKLVLLARAWRAAPDDPELKRLVSTSETREQILGDADALHVSATWEVLGERIETRRDGLVSHATWLLAVSGDEPRFALLQDYYPASAGRRSQAFSPGERFDARLVFYPARLPMRALVAERGGDRPSDETWPSSPVGAAADPLAAHTSRQDAAAWTSQSPLLLPAGSLARDERGALWWQADGGSNGIALPVAGSPPEAALGIPLDGSAGLWDGARLDLLAARTAFGRLDF
ncbi:SWIM zinc finger domain-containing protein [Mesorhizobium sp. IMUNJ 23232]|uniref:SWIM zinc finger domain-containing protein n=1 Tax=Mesorhizobium sp. IMUNJ 23232 TaxID=3376064 RepID=UPI00379E8185